MTAWLVIGAVFAALATYSFLVSFVVDRVASFLAQT
jgi:hypothetical protein